MTTSTSFAQVANNLLNVLQGCSKTIRLLLVMFLTLTVSASAWGAGIETFENAANSTSYNSVSWKGVNGLQWSANSFRTDQKISGSRGLTSKASTACTITMPLTSAQQSEGMGVFTFKYKYPYSDSGKKNNLSFTINGSTYTGTVSYNSNAQTVNITVNQSNLPATITINIASGGRACFDDFSWTSYVSADPYTVNWTINPTAGGTLSATSGNSTTVSPNAAYTYGASAYTVTSGAATVSQSGNTFTATPTANSTIQINMVEKPKYTVKFYKTSTTFESVTEASVGEGVTPPTMEKECGDWEFQGWSESSSNSETSTTPLSLVTLTNGKYYPAKDVDLYPVYVKSEGGGGTEYVLTDIGEISSGDIFVFADASNYALTNNNGTSSAVGVKQITVSNSKITSTVDATIEWQLTGNNTNGYTFYPGTGTTTWLYCNTTASSSSNNNMRVGTGDRKLFVVNNNGYLVTNDTYTDRYLSRYNTQDFRGYTNTNTNPVKPKLYKKTAGSTTYYYSYPQCTTEPSQLATPTGLKVTNITSTSATLSWNAVTHATSYTVQVYGENDEIIAEYTDLTQTTKEVSGLESDTYYIWAVTAIGDGTTYTDSEESETADFTTQKACTDAVNVMKGTPSNGSFTMVSGYQSTCNGPVTVTLSNIEPATGYQFSAITQSGVDAAKVTIDNTAKTVTYAKNTTGTSTINVTFTPAAYAINYKDQGGANFSGQHEAGYPQNHTYNTETTLKSASKNHYTFGGWYKESDCSGTEVTTLGATEYTNDITLYAKWTAKTYTITLDANGGTFVDNRDSQTKGSATFDYIYGTYANYNDAPNLTEYYTDLKRDGYQFDKWVSAGSPWNKLFTSTGDRTIQAQWSKLYTITLSENGTTTTPITQTSTSYTLPTGLSAGSCQDDTKELVGWSTDAIPNPGDKPTSNFYELGETVTLTADQTTFYAVFATAEGGGSSAELVKMTADDDFNIGDKLVIIAEGTQYGLYQKTSTSNYVDFWTTENNDGVPTLAEIEEDSKKYFEVSAGTATGSIKLGDATNGYLYNSSSTDMSISTSNSSDWSIIAWTDDTFTFKAGQYLSCRTDLTSANQNKWRGAGSNCNCETGSSCSGKIYYNVYKYTSGSSTSYSDYATTCVKLPDPVLSFATEPANPIVFTDVACGGNSSKQSVTVVGENLRDVVEVSVTGPYKIARTATTDLKDFTTSLTLDKTAAGAIHSNYKTVYIISTPPAQSTEATTGTLTFTTTKGNTLNVNLSTPTVTCTQYTLTLVDRGVSTEQPTKYYAGETINEAPADPEGVCTDPIHYVFDGWAEATVAAGATTYTKVTFPHTVEGNTKFYAVYRYVEDGGADSGDYVKVTSDLDDYSGDYLFVYETGNVAFDGGRNNVDDELDATSNTIEVTINGNTIASNATTDAAKFTIAKVDGGYSIKSASGYYIGRSATSNGLSTNETYSANYDLNTITDCKTIKGKGGNILKYNKAADQKRFRYYQSGQESIALYRKAASYLYTTSPVCGPHLAITEGKDIYVTGGNAGGTRDLVIAQKKVSYKATRLQTSNGLDDGTAPDVKVATNGITVGGVVTTDVKVTIDQTKEQQTDGTYTITGTITVQYQPSANNKQEDIQVQLAVDYNAEARDNFTVHARSLPAEFVIVAKSGDKWYALNGDMNTNAANPANGQVTLDDVANPTEATYAPCNAIYTFDGVPNTGDRTYVRFQGTDGAWLWASTNVGIQNNVLKTTPEGNNNAYNWKLETEDNITYRFGNANSSRQLTLSGEKFGMYASGVQDIRILPYVEKCLYNYAPSNLKVSVLKGTYVTLTWDAVAGATKYQYSTDATNWNDAGTETTVTINGLEGANEYTYYIRAYHEDAGVTQECIDYAEITFTTANCDDVPSNITYTADLSSITVSWTAAASTATITYNTKEDGTGGGGTIYTATSPYTISGGLNPNTTYYIQILADGTCGSPIIPVKTEDVKMDIVEWQPDGIVVDINTNEKVKVTLENEVSYGSGTGTVAEDLFFSKYFEGSGSLKMLAIYNGTGKDVDLSTYRIDRGTNGDATDISKTYDLSQLGIIKQGQEIVFYSWPLAKNTQGNSEYSYECSKSYLNNVATKSGQEDNPRWILCGNDPTGKATPIYGDAMNFSGDDPLLLRKNEVLIDVIGVSTAATRPTNKTLCTGRAEEAWSADGVTNMDYGKTEEDFEDGEIPHGVNVDDETITAYTARVIMFRKNTVVSGDDAVTKNIDNFVTFADEWEARQVCMSGDDGDLTCAAYQELGKFNYSEYYTKYESMDQDQEFDTNNRNADGTLTVPITELFKQSCRNIKITLKDAADNVLKEQPYKVPIMITTTQGTDGQTFIDLQQNLATVEVDVNGNPTGDKTNLTLEQVREICKTCDVVVRNNATLTKVTDGTTNDHPQVRNVYVYEGASIVIPDGVNHNYTINGLSLRRKGDVVASAQVQGTGKFVLPADEPVCLDLRVDANNWHWFTLPYDCDIADVTWIDGTPAKYNTDWFLMYYDGESRAASTNPYDNHWKVYSGTTIEAGKGYIVGITGDLTHPNYTFELRFPMAQGVLTEEQTNKTVPVNAWGVKSDNTPNNLGWNLVGNPYLNYYKTADGYSLAGLPLIEYTGIDPVTGDRLYDDSGNVPYVATPIDGGWYEYRQELASEVNMMPFTAYFVQVGDPDKHANGQALDASFEASNRGKKSIVRRALREVEEIEEPIIVRVELTNSKGESDKTSLVIDDRFTNDYEMNGDFFKWFGDYYNYYTKPVLYTIGADQGKRAFNALNEELAKQPIPMGMYAAQAGNYTFSLNQQFDLSRVEEVWLYDATQSTYTNLMQSDYTFSTSKVNGAGRFSLSVKLAPKVATSIDNVTADKVWATTHTKQVIVNGLENGMHLWLYDATGKLLYTEPTSNYQHTYAVPQTGTYFVSVMKGNAKQTIKVVVE